MTAAYKRPKPARTEYRPFDPADYPAYEFQPDGTPVRVVPATRGRFVGWTGPISSYVRKQNTGKKFSTTSEMFGITRGDGVQKQVSRATVLKALGQTPVPAVEPEDPWEGPAGNLFPRRSIDDFPDYVCDALGRVFRFQSPGRGRYARPFELGTVTPGHKKLRGGKDREGFYNLDSVTGHRRYLSRQRVLEIAGWTEAEQRSARTLQIAIS